jgi:glycosyltransferase involved in cell wall biosynthesis
MDADLQNDPADIPRLLAKLDEGYDVVSGWRRNRQDTFLNRTLPSRVANRLISLISGVHLHDYGCTLKAYRRDVVKDIKLYGEMHRFIPIYAVWYGAKVTELEVAHHPRKFGKSKYGFERVVKVLLDLIVIKFLGDFAHKPIYIFGGVGILCFIGAFLSGIWALLLKFIKGTSFIQTPLPLLCVLLLVLGSNAILLGLLAEIGIRTYYESQDKRTYLIKKTRNLPEE